MTCESENWLQIPCAPKYEINKRGDVRNIKTGQFLKPYIRKGRRVDKVFTLCLTEGVRPKKFHQAALLWLTHGIIPKRKTHSRIALPAIISKGNQKHYFDNCKQAARFLAPRVHYSVGHIEHMFNQRREEIFGWRINYQR